MRKTAIGVLAVLMLAGCASNKPSKKGPAEKPLKSRIAENDGLARRGFAFEKEGKLDKAEAAYAKAVSGPMSPDVRKKAKQKLAAIRRKRAQDECMVLVRKADAQAKQADFAGALATLAPALEVKSLSAAWKTSIDKRLDEYKASKQRLDDTRRQAKAFTSKYDSKSITKASYMSARREFVEIIVAFRKIGAKDDSTRFWGDADAVCASIVEQAFGEAERSFKQGKAKEAYESAFIALDTSPESRLKSVRGRAAKYCSAYADVLVKKAGALPKKRVLECAQLVQEALKIAPGHKGATGLMKTVRSVIAEYQPSYIKSVRALEDGAAYRLYVTYANAKGEPMIALGKATFRFVASGSPKQYQVYDLGTFTATVDVGSYKKSVGGPVYVSPRILFSKLRGPGAGSLADGWMKKEMWELQVKGDPMQVVYSHKFAGKRVELISKIFPPR